MIARVKIDSLFKYLPFSKFLSSKLEHNISCNQIIPSFSLSYKISSTIPDNYTEGKYVGSKSGS